MKLDEGRHSMQLVSSAAAPGIGGLGLWAREGVGVDVQCLNPCACTPDNSKHAPKELRNEKKMLSAPCFGTCEAIK